MTDIKLVNAADFIAPAGPKPSEPPTGADILSFKSREERGEEIRAAIQHNLKAICLCMDEANDLGMIVNFQLGKDAHNKNGIAALLVATPHGVTV